MKAEIKSKVEEAFGKSNPPSKFYDVLDSIPETLEKVQKLSDKVE